MTENKRNGARIIMILLILILTSSFSTGLGLMPASKTILLGQDSEEFTITIINNDKQDLELAISAQGDLSEYITFDKEKISMMSNEDRADIKVKMNIPSNHDLTPGEHTTKISIMQQATGDGDVSAKLSISFRLTTRVPYDGAYLDINLYAPNFDKTKGGNFIIQAQNTGSENALSVVPIIDIYSSTNHKIVTLRGEEKLVGVGETYNFAIPLTEDLENGIYSARASVVYQGASNKDEKIFTVGSPEVIIDSISALSFTLGGIAGFDIFLKSNWGEEIRGVFANVEFRRDNKVLEQTTTATVDIPPMDRTRLQTYFDTKEMPAGIYDLVIKLNYLGETKTETQQIRLETDKISLIGTGKVVEEVDETDNTGILIVVIFFLVLLNGLLIYKFVIKKKNLQNK
jgi:hypothetical protein